MTVDYQTVTGTGASEPWQSFGSPGTGKVEARLLVSIES